MRIKILVIWIASILPGILSSQNLPLLFQDDRSPLVDVLVYSKDKIRYSISNQQGLVNWYFNQLPDTFIVSHTGYMDQEIVIHPHDTISKPFPVILQLKIIELRAAQIEAHWVKPNSMIVASSLNEKEIESKLLVQDVPYILEHLPSTISSSDAGNGIGYTNIRIRGLDPTQINVMINGVPLNDAESQSVFWVDLPDLIASASDIQVQRGIGVSGAGQVAFGSSLLIKTNKLVSNPMIQIESSSGSFSTLKNSIQVHSGMINNKWNFSGRFSRVYSAGYIDRASTNLWSGSLSMAYLRPHRSLRFFMFDGIERTYQAWYGVPSQYINDPVKRRFNPAGTEKSGHPYENQIDRYRQTHFQFLHKEIIGNHWELQNTLHFTPGIGYYEEYKADQLPSDYSLPGDTEINLVRRRNLDNDFFGAIHSAQYQHRQLELNTGLAWNGYLGRHFGEVKQINDQPFQTPENYYDQKASKWSAMGFGNINLKIKNWSLLADIQYRWIKYRYVPELGNDPSTRTAHHHFVNPKFGVSADLNPDLQLFVFSGLAHREPNRNDYVEADHVIPKSERLWDHELGARWNHHLFHIEQNLYLMLYKNQLIPTGKLNDVGAYIRSNVDRSYRLGSETTVSWVKDKWNLEANLNLSRNRSIEYVEYLDNWDTGTQQQIIHKKRPIAFSPSMIGNLTVDFKLVDRPFTKSQSKLNLEFAQQFIGSQYLDGTGQEPSSLKNYQLTQMACLYHLKLSKNIGMDLRLQLNNIFNQRYESNGWIYRFRSDGYNPVPDDPNAAEEGAGIYHLKGLYPQAGRNFLFSCRFKIGSSGE